MARTFRRHRTAHPLADLNVTNLVDLAFVLLLIFMIATPLINQEQAIPVNLPVETRREQAKPDKDTRFVSISIDRQGRYFFDSTPVSFSELSSRLVPLAAGPAAQHPVIRIRAGFPSAARISTFTFSIFPFSAQNLMPLTSSIEHQAPL